MYMSLNLRFMDIDFLIIHKLFFLALVKYCMREVILPLLNESTLAY